MWAEVEAEVDAEPGTEAATEAEAAGRFRGPVDPGVRDGRADVPRPESSRNAIVSSGAIGENCP